MKGVVASLVLLLAIGWIAIGVHAVTIGVGVAYELTGLVFVGALTETSINESIDVRANVGFAVSDIAGLMLVMIDVVRHWAVPPLDPYLGVGIGAALTPPPFSSGLVVEGVVGLRAKLSPVVQLFLQARYLLRKSGGGWNDGPLFEGGLLVRF